MANFKLGKPDGRPMDLQIIDDALSKEELEYWQKIIKTGIESESLTEDKYIDTDLYKLARKHVPDLKLGNCLAFNVMEGQSTSLHNDIGEYSVIYFPYTNPRSWLRTRVNDVIDDIDVIENRLVLFPCQEIEHQQVIPDDGTVRYSIVFKFFLLVDGEVNDKL